MYRIVITNRRDCCQSRTIGAKLVILDDKRTPVYRSDAITETSSTYTWFPPSPNIYNNYTKNTPLKKPYSSLGCWRDTGDRAVTPQEGTDPTLDHNYYGRFDAINKCATVALNRGLKYFAIQHNGWCAASNDLIGAKRYGPAGNCSNGKGGGWANDLYQLSD
jgi:hypothetical protein